MISTARTLKGFRRRSIPDVALVELDVVFSEQATEFVLERFLAVVLLLVLNVFLKPAHMRRTERKSAVAILPIELLQVRELFLDPNGGAPLHLLNEIRRGHRLRKTAEKVYVVLDSSRFNAGRIEIIADLCEPLVHYLSTRRILQERLSFLRRKD